MNDIHSAQGDWLPYVLMAWVVVWVCVLGRVLTREDFDPITRLTWVVVVTFVPFFGVVLYLSLAPSSRGWDGKKIHPANQLSGTPWENKPGHRQPR